MFHSFMPRLLIKILNKIGSRIDSSGIPLLPSLQLDNLLQHHLLSSPLPHVRDFVLIFIFSILTNDFPCGTVSNTLLESRKIKFSASPLPKKSFILSEEAVGLAWCYFPLINTGSVLQLSPCLSPAAEAGRLLDVGSFSDAQASNVPVPCPHPVPLLCLGAAGDSPVSSVK